MSSFVLVTILSGVLFATGVYMLLQRNLIRAFLGLAVLSNAINLMIMASGGLHSTLPPLVGEGLQAPGETVANPLSQALVLTAIVIGFALMTYALVLTKHVYRATGATDGDKLGLRGK